MQEITIPRKLLPFLEKKKRFKIAYGGRGAAKSQTIADILISKAYAGAKIGCFREMQNSIEDSVHSLLKDEISRLEFDGFTPEKATIYHSNGGEFRFKGLSRNPDAIKSMHGFKYFWVEEAQSISQESLDKLTPTLRTEDSEIWFTLNPQSSEDPMSKRFIKPFESELLKNGYYEDDLHLIICINYYDNPWFPSTLEQERLWDKGHKSRAEYDHIWLGMFNDSVENSIISTEWFDAAIDAHIKLGFEPRGAKVLAHDPADSGDARADTLMHGSVVLNVRENEYDDVNDALDWSLDYAIENKVDMFIWDADGLGLSLKRQVAKSLNGKKIEASMFHGGSEVDDPDAIYQPINLEIDKQQKTNKGMFKNKKAQYSIKLRDKFYNTWRAVEKGEYVDPDEMISLSSNIENMAKLRAEVCRIPRKPNGSGLIQIMPKPEMKAKLKIASPNMFDSVMMAQVRPAIKNNFFAQELTYDIRGYV